MPAHWILSLVCPLVAVPSPSQDAAAPGETSEVELWGALEPGPHTVGLRVTDLGVPEVAPAPPVPFGHGYRRFLWYPAAAIE